MTQTYDRALAELAEIHAVFFKLFEESRAIGAEYSAYLAEVSKSNDFSEYDQKKAEFREKAAECDSKIVLHKIKHNVLVEILRTKFNNNKFLPFAMSTK